MLLRRSCWEGIWGQRPANQCVDRWLAIPLEFQVWRSYFLIIHSYERAPKPAQKWNSICCRVSLVIIDAYFKKNIIFPRRKLQLGHKGRAELQGSLVDAAGGLRLFVHVVLLPNGLLGQMAGQTCKSSPSSTPQVRSFDVHTAVETQQCRRAGHLLLALDAPSCFVFDALLSCTVRSKLWRSFCTKEGVGQV